TSPIERVRSVAAVAPLKGNVIRIRSIRKFIYGNVYIGISDIISTTLPEHSLALRDTDEISCGLCKHRTAPPYHADLHDRQIAGDVTRLYPIPFQRPWPVDEVRQERDPRTRCH